MDDGMEKKLLQEEDVADIKQRIWIELKTLLTLAFPCIVSLVSTFGTLVVTQLFIGHVSSTHLAGYALVQTLIFPIVNGIITGLASAMGTLCGQSFGARQPDMMGVHLQRSWIVSIIALTILLPILIFGTQIFKLMGEEESVAKSGGYISLWFIPFVYSFLFSVTIQLFLQAQSKNIIVAWLSALQFAIHVLLSLLFVYGLNSGVWGAMFALSLSSWFLIVGEFIYIFGGWCPGSWKGFTFAAFKDLKPVVKLSISSCAMVCLGLWYNVFLALLVDYMGNPEVALSAFSICLNVSTWESMVGNGFLGAGCVRVATQLGRGNEKAVKFSIKVLLGIAAAIGGFFFIIFLVFGRNLGYLFTNDERVIAAVADLSLLLSFSVLLNSFFPILTAVAIGACMQDAAAVVNLICFYVIGIPLGALLGYLTPLGVKGVWIGMIGGFLAQAIAVSYMIWRTNWNDEVKKSRARLARLSLKTDENSEQIY